MHNRVFEENLIVLNDPGSLNEIYNPLNHFWCLGYEKTFSKRITLGLNLLISHSLDEEGRLDKVYPTGFGTNYDAYSGKQVSKGYGIEYISKYYFSEIEEGAPSSSYLGTTFSHIIYQNVVTLQPNQSVAVPDPNWKGEFERNTNVTQMGFRWGFEYCFDHIAWETFVGMNYNLVSHTDNRAAHPVYTLTYYPNLSFVWGMNFGYHF